jgi:nucleoside-diphosphate-sugar epimerase
MNCQKKSNKKILIVGSGFLGLPLAIKLKGRGFEVSVTTTQANKLVELKKTGLTAIKFDCNCEEDYHQFSGLKLDFFVFSLPPKSCARVGYKAVLQRVIKSLPNSTTIIFTSSTSVYENNGSVHDENSEQLKESAVIDVEKFIKNNYPQHYIFRLAGLIGEDRHPKFFFKKPQIDNCNQVVNLVLGNDVVELIAKSIKEIIPYGIYNICSPDHPARKDYYEKYIPEPTFKEGTEGKIIDGSLISQQLNYKYNDIFL